MESDVMANTSEKDPGSSQPGDDGSYYSTWTVYIALAVPRAIKKDTKKDSSADKRVKAQRCYHIEYKLLPGDTETTKVDLLVFGPGAKIYKDNESQLLRTSYEGDQIWVGWSHSYNIRVNRDTLISLPPHKITLNIWNTMNKLSSALAQSERLKLFKMPKIWPEDATNACDEIRTMVTELTAKIKKGDLWLDSNLDEASEKDKNLALQATASFQKPNTDACDLGKMGNIGSISVELSPIRFLAGETSVTERFQVNSTGVFEVMCSISLERPLLSDQLKAELNPLVIRILSATSMPTSPAPLHLLQEKCVPVYCQYKFHNVNVHRTNHHEHGANIYFRDVNVILIGLMNQKELQDFFAAPSLRIEVHDYDRKVKKRQSATCDTGSDDAVHNTYGIANLNLSELIRGRKSITADLPIKCGPPPPKLDRGSRGRNSKMTDTAAGRDPMPRTHCYGVNAKLRVSVEMACPLVTDDAWEFYTGPFGRIVYLFHYNNFPVFTKLRSEILRINASAFHLDSPSLESRGSALSNEDGAMISKLDESTDRDFVTGFHVQDERMHILVLEGLKHEAVRRLWEAVPIKLSGTEAEQGTILYNSNLGFFKRIYDSLDFSLSPIHLRESLQSIMRQPLIYVRGKVPQPCFQALSRLSQLCQVRQLKDAVRCDLFPSADMIVSMTREYGKSAELNPGANTKIDLPTRPARMKRHAALDTANEEYIRWKHNRHNMSAHHFRDYIQENIQNMQDQSEQLQKPEGAMLRLNQAASIPVHNYSTQTWNSNVQTRELLCREMAKVPGRRFTYCQEYNSATVEPGNMAPDKHSDSTAACQAWLRNLSSEISRVPPRHPDEARVEELKKPWRENILHANTLKPPLTRDRWVWSKRREDFELYRKPPAVVPLERFHRGGQMRRSIKTKSHH